MDNIVAEVEKEQMRRFQVKGRVHDKKMLVAALSKDFSVMEERKVVKYWHIVLEGRKRYGVYANDVLCEVVSEEEFDKIDFGVVVTL